MSNSFGLFESDEASSPEDAVTAALLLQPGCNRPWPEHLAYSAKYSGDHVGAGV